MQLLQSGTFIHRSLLSIVLVSLVSSLSIEIWAQQSAPASAAATDNQKAATPSGSSNASGPSAPAPANNGVDLPRPSLAPAFDPVQKVPMYETIQEDWSSLTIGTSKLQPEKPLVGETDEQPGFVRSLVQVKWRPGDPIDLWVIMPKGVKKPPVVLYLYGYQQDTERFKNDAWAARVTGGGAAAVGFVSALTGQRFHDRPMKQWFVSELQESLGSTVHDVKFILDYLAERGDVDMGRVGMFGEGSGGAVAILAAAADPRIKAVDTLEPWGDWPDFLKESAVVQEDPERDEFVKPAFLARVANLDPVKWLPQLTIPIRIQQIRQHNVTPMDCKEGIRLAAPKQAVVARFDTAEVLGEREGQGRLFDWIKMNLPKSAKTDSEKAKTDVAVDKALQAKSENGSVSHH
jgi:hypothetical protein